MVVRIADLPLFRQLTGKTMRKTGAFLLALAVVAGCASTRGTQVTYHDSNMDFGSLQNVAVMPFANLTTNTNAADRVRDVFMTMLQAAGAVYVLPPGEVGRGISRTSLSNPLVPTPEEVVAFSKNVKVDAVITGAVREYGEVRSGTSTSNIISVSVRMMEGQTGKVVWSASSTQGGITTIDRLFGGGGDPMNAVTEKAVKDLLDKLFGK